MTEPRHQIEKTPIYQRKQMDYFDTKRCTPITHQGDLVLLNITSSASTGSRRKLLSKWKGPLRITGTGSRSV